jgi:hypothetical protein
MMADEPKLSKHYDPIFGAYGGEIRVYESSAASHPHIWVAIEEPVDLNAFAAWSGPRDEYPGMMKEAHSHLRLEDAVRLRDQLTHLIDHHYQMEGDDGSGT